MVLLENKQTTLAENGENLVSAQPRIRTQSQGLKVQKFNKRPGRLWNKHGILRKQPTFRDSTIGKSLRNDV